MRVLVCGGRNFGVLEKHIEGNVKREGPGYEQYVFAYEYLNKLAHDRFPRYPEDAYGNYMYDVTIISGEAAGADSIATDWAVVNWTDYQGYPADWKKHGRKAGAMRNHLMLTEGKPDLVVAFPGGRGTAHMVQIAKEAGVEVIEVEYV